MRNVIRIPMLLFIVALALSACSILQEPEEASGPIEAVPLEIATTAPAEEVEEAVEEPAEEPAADAVGQPVPCNELAAVRYPFLTCVRGPSGRPVFADVAQGFLQGIRSVSSEAIILAVICLRSSDWDGIVGLR